MGMHWEQGEKTKNPFLPPKRKKNWNIDEIMLEISTFKTIHHHFWLGLIPPFEIGVTLMGTHWEQRKNEKNPPQPPFPQT
jgi:hypothetical protein